MTFSLTAPHLHALHDKIAAYRLALAGLPGAFTASAGMQGGQWVADILMGEAK